MVVMLYGWCVYIVVCLCVRVMLNVRVCFMCNLPCVVAGVVCVGASTRDIV